MGYSASLTGGLPGRRKRSCRCFRNQSKSTTSAVASSNAAASVVFDFSGAVFYGYEDFKAKIAQAWTEVYQNGGFAFVKA